MTKARVKALVVVIKCHTVHSFLDNVHLPEHSRLHANSDLAFVYVEVFTAAARSARVGTPQRLCDSHETCSMVNVYFQGE